MDAQITAIKNRIKELRGRNKQINTMLNANASEAQEDVLNDEKERNNDEIRKERSKRYSLQQTSQESAFMKECCERLQQMGIIKSRYQFCEEFLNKSPHYLSMILCENRVPSIDVLHFLLENLKSLSFAFQSANENSEIAHQLKPLIYKGQAIISSHLSKYL